MTEKVSDTTTQGPAKRNRFPIAVKILAGSLSLAFMGFAGLFTG